MNRRPSTEHSDVTEHHSQPLCALWDGLAAHQKGNATQRGHRTSCTGAIYQRGRSDYPVEALVASSPDPGSGPALQFTAGSQNQTQGKPLLLVVRRSGESVTTRLPAVIHEA